MEFFPIGWWDRKTGKHCVRPIHRTHRWCFLDKQPLRLRLSSLMCDSLSVLNTTHYSFDQSSFIKSLIHSLVHSLIIIHSYRVSLNILNGSFLGCSFSVALSIAHKQFRQNIYAPIKPSKLILMPLTFRFPIIQCKQQKLVTDLCIIFCLFLQ